MFTNTQLLALHQSLHDRQVLSVYIDRSAADPAMQHAWRVHLNHALDSVDGRLRDAAAGERADFDRCRRMLDTWLEHSAAEQSSTIAAFFTANGLAATLPLPDGASTRVEWTIGGALGPLVGLPKQRPDVVVALADARHATVYRYRRGLLDRVERVRSHHPIEHAAHMGTPPRNGFHSGTRGRTARDAAQRALRRGRDRMLNEAVARITGLIDHEGWIVVAGTDPIASKLMSRLETLAPGRVGRATEIDLHSTQAEVTAAAVKGATSLSEAFDLQRLADIAEAAGAHGLGALGEEDVTSALRESSVRTLLVSAKHLSEHSATADEAIRAALDQHAEVEQVFGAAACMLDEHAGGVAAALRFRTNARRPERGQELVSA